MCKYRGIAPENDPCLYIDGKGGVSIIDSISQGILKMHLLDWGIMFNKDHI